MSKLKFTFIFLISLISSGHSLGAILSLGEEIEALIQKIDPDLHYGIVIESLDSNTPFVFEKNANHYFLPASTVKILTAAAALKELGANYRYETKLWTQLNSNGPTNLYLKFSGDPSFTSNDLRNLFEQLKNQGLKEISGDLFYDASGYKLPSIYGGWMCGDVETCEVTSIHKAIIDENYFNYTLSPGPTIGGPALLVSQSGITPGYPVVNHTTTTGKGLGQRRHYSFENNAMGIRGRMEISSNNERVELPIKDFNRFIKAHIKKAAKEAGLPVNKNLIKEM